MYDVLERPVAEVKNNYTELAAMLREHNRIVLTNEGKEEAVLIGIDDYAAYEEYAHKQYVREKLAEAEAMAASPDAVWLSEEEFWKAVE
jgi:PHD/YefM family antitoxin component YafN of YafNO toxin-antitoxin module